MFISLLTDFGESGHWIGVMKGVILNITPDSEIIDLTHSIPSHDIKTASFLLKASHSYFPQETIHLTVVDPGVGTKRKVLIAKTDKYYFVAPDNGVLSWALNEEKVEKIINVTNKKYFLPEVSSTFWGRDVFAPVAAHIATGVKLEEFGEELQEEDIKRIKLPLMQMQGDCIKGEVLYVDKFGNLITNIERDKAEKYFRGKEFTLYIGGEEINIMASNYQEACKDKLFTIWGSTGYLEIAKREDKASRALGLGIGERIKVKFS